MRQFWGETAVREWCASNGVHAVVFFPPMAGRGEAGSSTALASLRCGRDDKPLHEDESRATGITADVESELRS